MADLRTPSEPAPPAARPDRLLLSQLTRWWPLAETSSSVDPALGYESALPWTLGDTPDGHTAD